ncbi:hypothetical protein [Streptomyces cupreus]|uniref:Serine peptidase n=1 Tax=Streptomyces cupreus TaxID=2759956 RepID=A0A7X1MDR5_9ACTN|nr:hypothetical protein [Streptomyces cupreus]MBC2907794.1 hypothetical protein [Streptomyces cupreus]
MTAAPVARADVARVVAVHGVGYHNRRLTPKAIRADHAQHWTRHLTDGLGVEPDRLSVDFAYYAHLLNPAPVTQGQNAADSLSDPLARELMAQWLTELGAPAPIAQGKLTRPLRASASWVAEKFSLDGRLTELFVRLFFSEVATYLRHDDDPVRLSAREEVADRIARQRPQVVIAHSLGTVVAYEALHAHPELQVDLFLTLGSPLALPHAVFHRLDPRPVAGAARSYGQRPPGVRRWVNIADPGDPVAIPPGLDRAFHGVDLDLTTPVHAAFGFHHAKNYLRCAPMAEQLAPFIAGTAEQTAREASHPGPVHATD